MASVAYVTSDQVLMENEQQNVDCPVSVQLPCASIQPQGTAWLVPIVNSGGILIGYNINHDTAKPTPDSVNTVRLWDKERNVTYWAAIDDADDETVFIDRCNACCGATPVMPTVTIPAPITEDCPCADSDGNYTFFFPVPDNPNTLDFLITNGTFNGVAGTPTPAAGGYANIAAVLTFLQTAVTGWAAYGTWSLVNSNKTIKLVSATTECANVVLGLEEASYCFEIPGTATPVNGIKIGAGTPVNTEFPQISFDDTTAARRQAIIDAIQPFLPQGTLEIVDDSGTYYLKYTGISLPVNLTLDGSDVAGTTFSTGACP